MSRTRPLEWSSSRLTEAEVLNSLASSAAGPATPQSTESTPSPRDSQQEALIAAQKQENAQKQNEDFLQQIEELAAETNALKKERRERISKFAETKNEYAATLKFARDQQQQKLLALQKENRLLAEKLAALSGPNTSETPQEAQPSPTPSPQEGQPPQAPAFAQSDDDLDQSRRVLVNAIRDMDALSGDALATRYQELETKLGTKSSGRVRFVSGSSQANATEVAKIEELAKASKTDSQFLIVGFADRSGSASGNRRLSSKRAKFVAEQLGKKVGNSRVQAIYIGQTARFGPAAENRVVEIWQIPATPPKQ
ncbi:MAG: OmpA family protein [Roseibacillus sp.]